jgi:purine-binding chemotaxis protein CheW
LLLASLQLVVFELDGTEYGVEALAVNGILRAKKFSLKSVPGIPKVIEGMINVRGKVNYIFNLRTRFNLPPKPIHEESKFMMMNLHNSIAGCIVDEVTDIIRFNEEDIQPAPSFIAGTNATFMKGIGQKDDRLIVILDPNKILTTEEHAAIVDRKIYEAFSS